MARLVFNATDLLRVVDHSIANKQARFLSDWDEKKKEAVYSVPAKPAVLLVKDSGIYMMSNGDPGDLVDPSKANEKFAQRYIVYAKGCNPKTDGDDVWEKCQRMVGGDDFGETIEWADAIKELITRGAKEIIVNFTTRKMSLSAK
jgi:hypothetical protein